MNKKILKTLVLGYLLSMSATAFAANPFEIVPTTNWAYDAIGNLQQAGVYEGYRDVNFSKSQTFTRYELATFVGKAMANQSKVTPAQKATLDKLADEFKVELGNLGVYTAATTPAVATPAVAAAPAPSPFKVNGYFKYQYRNNQDKAFDVSNSGNRMYGDLELSYKATDTTTFFTRIAGSINPIGRTVASKPNDFKMDQFGVKTMVDGWQLSLGRQGVQLGQGGPLYAGGDVSPSSYFDGIIATNKINDINVTAVVGKTTANDYNPTQRWTGIDLNKDFTKNLNVGMAFSRGQADPGTPSDKATITKNASPSSTYSSLYTTVKGGVMTYTAEYLRSNASRDNTAYDLSAKYTIDDKNNIALYYFNVKENSADLISSLIGGEYQPNYSGFTGGYKGTFISYNHKFDNTVSFNAQFYALKPINAGRVLPGGSAGDVATSTSATNNEFAASLKWKF